MRTHFGMFAALLGAALMTGCLEEGSSSEKVAADDGVYEAITLPNGELQLIPVEDSPRCENTFDLLACQDALLTGVGDVRPIFRGPGNAASTATAPRRVVVRGRFAQSELGGVVFEVAAIGK